MPDLKRLLSRHYKIIDLILEGKSRKEIAEICNITPAGAGNVMNAPLVQEEIARRRLSMNKAHDEAVAVSVSQARDLLETAAVDAAQTHISLLEDDDSRVRQASATAILDRVGLGRVDQNKGVDVQVLNVEQLQVLNLALEEERSGMDEDELHTHRNRKGPKPEEDKGSGA